MLVEAESARSTPLDDAVAVFPAALRESGLDGGVLLGFGGDGRLEPRSSAGVDDIGELLGFVHAPSFRVVVPGVGARWSAVVTSPLNARGEHVGHLVLASRSPLDEGRVEVARALVHRLEDACVAAGQSITQLTAAEVLESITDAYIGFDADWVIVDMNRRASDLMRRTRASLIGRRFFEAFPMVEGTEVVRALKRAMSDGVPVELEFESVVAPGKFAELRAFPASGGLSIFFRDVTEKVWAKRALEASEARHRAMFDHTVDGLLFATPDGQVLQANPAACEILGRSEEELKRTGRAGFLDVSDPRLAAFLEQRLRTGRARSELTAVRADGTRFPVESTSATFRDEHGQLRASISFRNITQQRRGEELLKVLSDASRALLGDLDREAMVSRLGDVLVPRLSDACAIDLVEDGRERALVRHRDPAKAGVMEVLRRYPWRAAQTSVEPPPSELHVEVEDADLVRVAHNEEHLQCLRALSIRSAIRVPLLAHDQALGMLTLVFTKDSERRYGPADLTLAEDLAARSSLALQTASLYRDARRAVRVREEILAVVSHDLRNPLSGIRLRAQSIARTTPKGTPTCDAAESIQRQTDQMNGLIGLLLDFGKMEAGQFSVDVQRCDFGELVDEAIASLRPLAVAKEQTLSCERPKGPITMQADTLRIAQVFSNVIGNAIKFTPRGGSVSVRLVRHDGELHVAITDSGPGIPKIDLQHVFDRWWHVSRGGAAGTGLGLYISRGIIEAHGGRTWIESEGGAGTSVCFSLPYVEPSP
ncbi:MAG: sensor histidine kinase [Polyangiales bacterium]